MKTCIVCNQDMRREASKIGPPVDGEAAHHLDESPIDPTVCLGCFMGWIEFEKFLLRATGRVWWTLQVYDIMRGALQLATEADFTARFVGKQAAEATSGERFRFAATLTDIDQRLQQCDSYESIREYIRLVKTGQI